MQQMKFDIGSDGIAVLTWDMPGRAMNVLSNESLAEFSECITRIKNDAAIKGAVITSGKDSFLAGADLTLVQGITTPGAGASREQRVDALYASPLVGFSALLRTLETCGKPVAAAINGIALGGGLEIALGCHYRVCADNAAIQLGLPESKVGLLPGGGGTQRLPRLIGIPAALPMLLQGEPVSPQQALKLGIIHKIVPADEIVQEAKRWLKETPDAQQPWDKKNYKIPGGGPYDGGPATEFYAMAIATTRKMGFGNYPAQEAILSCVYEGIQAPMDAGLRIETRLLVNLFLHPSARNMVRSLFISSGELAKGARRPKAPPKSECRKIAVLGAGMMGSGIAYVSAMAGIEVVLMDSSLENAAKGKAYSENLLSKAVEKGKTSAAEKDAVLARITPATDYSGLGDVDLVIEAVFEDREVKAAVTGKAEAVMPATSIFASNTSTLPITGLADRSSRPEQFIGVHFFSPVDRMGLVEIIMGKKTSDKALAVAIDYVRKIRKTPIVVNDSRGFYTSRVFSTYVNEGIAMLTEGVKPALIDNVGKMTGMPVGPLAVNDEVSLELTWHIAAQTRKDLGAAYKPTAIDALLEEMVVKQGRLGKKNRKGWYDYPEGAKKKLWPGIAQLVKQSASQPDVEELKKRFLYVQALDTARCFEEGVLTDVRDADVGAIQGWGFAPYTGGPLSMIDTIGAAEFVRECDRMAQAYGERFAPNKLLREMAAKGESFYGRFNPKQQAA
ncbi:MAG: 3-hydroxyacyl-CoA dehydrogenase NAD-binding domain-containing protein [Alphaproteobacteria bacterium]